MKEKTAEERKEQIQDMKDKFEKTDQIARELTGLCNFLQKYLDATGVYIGHVERMKRPITDESDDKAHVDETGTQIIFYVAACNDHKFMVNNMLETEGSITYSVFQPEVKEEEQEQEQKEEISEIKEEEVKVKEPAYKFIPDVTREPKLKFFRVPRLGCYMAISLKYNSCLYDTSLDKAIEDYFDTQQKKEAQEKEKREFEAKEEQEKEVKESAGETYESPNVDWPKIEEPPYQTHEREYVLCIDTMGKDRVLSEAERKFALGIAGHVVKCWEKCEAEALTKDKMLRIAIKARNEEFKDKEMADYNDAIEKGGEEALGDETL